MNIEIYINDRPVKEFSQEEMLKMREKLTYTAMQAAGYVPAPPATLEGSKRD